MLSFYAVMFVVFYGWGQIAVRVLRLRNQSALSSFTLAWVGWAVALFVLQALHLAFPIDFRISALITVTGVAASFVVLNKRSWRIKRASLIHYFYALLILGSAVWIASRSMLAPSVGDIYLYYFNTMSMDQLPRHRPRSRKPSWAIGV
jgi:hypothetical protein